MITFQLLEVRWAPTLQDLLEKTQSIKSRVEKIFKLTDKSDHLHLLLISAIYALDPAGPYFELIDAKNRLNKNDAQFTIGLRTNSGKYALGYPTPLAEMEFYANGGKEQPGCLPGM